MARKLFDDTISSPISPLIDVVMNGMGAMFIILMIYLVIVRPGKPSEPLKFLAEVEPPPAISGHNYVFTFPVTGGAGKRQFTLIGDVPEELRFDPETGTLYGIPRGEPSARTSASRDFLLQVKVQDGDGHDARSATLRLYPGAVPYDPARMPLEIVAKTLPPGRMGAAYEAVLGAIGGMEPYTWRVGQASLPKGLALQNNGRLVGTPQQAGSFRIEVEVNHTRGTFTYQGHRYEWAAAAQQRVYHLEIAESLQHVLHLPVGRVGEQYLGVVLTNGRLPGERVHWTGEVPGLRPSDHEGALRGTPSTAGVFPVSYQISSGQTQFGTGAGELRILPKRPTPSVPRAVFHARIGETFRADLPYRGMTEPVRLTAHQALPAGLTIADTAIQGVPEQAGDISIPVQVEDALGTIAQGDVVLHILPRLKPLTLEVPESLTLVVGPSVYIHPTATGGTGEYEWQLAGQRPPDLTMSPTGAIQGRLLGPGMWTVDVSVRDRGTGERLSQPLTLRGVYADETTPRIVTTAIPSAIVGHPFEIAIAVTGGIGHPRFHFQGALPDGLVLTETGITGTPTGKPESEAPVFEVTVIDAVGQRAGPQRFTVPIMTGVPPPPLRVLTHELPPVVPGLKYPITFAAEGGRGAYTWTIRGQLPAGLHLTPYGLDGTVDPVAHSMWPLQISVQDEGGQLTSASEVHVQVADLTYSRYPQLPAWLMALGFGACLMIGFRLGQRSPQPRPPFSPPPA